LFYGEKGIREEKLITDAVVVKIATTAADGKANIKHVKRFCVLENC
jgi:uncharacterized protein YggU (UPF0235/DUF167 family)